MSDKSSVPSWLQAIPYLGSGLSFINSLFSKDKTSEYINQQFDNNVKMWNMQNAYNTPAAQKSRLEAAGFNPMFYGPDGNTAQQLSPVDIAGASNAASTREQVRLAKEQQALQTAQNVANIELTKAQASKARADAKVANNTIPVQIGTVQELYNQIFADVRLKDEQILASSIENILKANSLGYKGTRNPSQVAYNDYHTLDSYLSTTDDDEVKLSPEALRVLPQMQREFNAKIENIIKNNENLSASSFASIVAAQASQYDLDFFKKYHINRSDSLISRLIVGVLQKFGFDLTFE